MLAILRSEHPDRTILGAAAAGLAVAFLAGMGAPPVFWLALEAAVGLGIGFLAWRQPVLFCVLWLLVTAASLEMTLHDLIAEPMYQTTIAAVKGLEIALALLCGLRFGLRIDWFSPIWAYGAMLAAGMVHGLYPGLTTADSLRSLIGSAAPFLFGFCRLPRQWAEAMIRTVKWCPLLVVLADVPLAAAGVRPLFVDSGGARLAGLGHPAFLANVCLPAVYACLIQLFRQGRSGDLGLLGLNMLILFLTGARAPMAYAVGVSGICFLTLRSEAFPMVRRLPVLFAIAAALPVLLLVAGDFADIRLFNMVANEATNLSGRDLLWPAFRLAAAQSPWVGWGIGAGNVIIPPTGEVARTLHTWAAHNEYLRMEVEGGEVGRALLIALFGAWTYVHTRVLCATDRRIMRLAMLAFAALAMTDNVLISTPACVLFAFAVAVFTRRQEPVERFALRWSGRVA